MMAPRTLAILLAVSVALNVFVLGVLAAWVWHGNDGSHRDHRSPSRLEHRREAHRERVLGWLSEAERTELRARRRALREVRRQAEEALRAESYDGEQLQSSLAALRAETVAIQTSVHEHLLRRASELGPEERRRLADAHWHREQRRRPALAPRRDLPSRE